MQVERVVLRQQAPPLDEIRRVFQPVEFYGEHDVWQLGRINAWWTSTTGVRWCRLRLLGATTPAQWMRYDPERIRLLPASGL